MADTISSMVYARDRRDICFRERRFLVLRFCVLERCCLRLFPPRRINRGFPIGRPFGPTGVSIRGRPFGVRNGPIGE